jgi:hypothetical protein
MALKWLTSMDENEFECFLRTIMPINTEAHMLRNFITTVNDGLVRALADYREECEKPIDVNDEYRHYIEEAQQDTLIEIGGFYPSFAWSSTFISVYTLLEHEMISIVKHMGEVKGVDKHPEHKSYVRDGRKGIFAAREYLVANFDMDPANDRRWNEFDDFAQIRNCLAHDRGIVGEPRTDLTKPLERGQARDEKIRDYVARNPTLISIDSDRRLSLGIEICNHAIDLAEGFLNQVIDEARLWLHRWNEEKRTPIKKPFQTRYLCPRTPFTSNRE